MVGDTQCVAERGEFAHPCMANTAVASGAADTATPLAMVGVMWSYGESCDRCGTD